MSTPPRPLPRKTRTSDVASKPVTSPQVQYCPPSLSTSFSEPFESLGFGGPTGNLHGTQLQQPHTSPHGDMTMDTLAADLEALHLEVEQQKNTRDLLVSEVSTLHHQKEMMEDERQQLLKEMNDLNQQLTSLKQKIAQYEQNLEAFQSLSKSQSRSEGHDDEEREYQLREREMAVERREMELKGEEDILWQRKKELDLREFDLGQVPGQQQQQHMEHAAALQARERDVHERESRLHTEKDRLENWAAELEEADRRAKENHLRARKTMDEALRMQREAQDFAAAISVELDQRNGGKSYNAQPMPGSSQTFPRHSTTNTWGTTEMKSGATPSPQQWSGGQSGWQTTTPPYQSSASGVGGGSSNFATGGFQPTSSPSGAGYLPSSGSQPMMSPAGDQRNSGREIIQSQSSPHLGRLAASQVKQDAKVAEQLQLEMRGERFRQDAELARQLAEELNAETKHNTDEDLVLQLLKEELGTDVSDPDALQKLALEQYEKTKKAQEAAKRDEELARQLMEQQNED